MYFQDDIIITKKGLRIRPQALYPIGISDKSVCWAIAVPPAPSDKENRTPDLLISEFHPNSWHVLFRLKIELKDEPGTLLKVIEILNKNKVFNILSTQCAPSGYKHATWNIIGEALEERENIRKVLEDIIKPTPSNEVKCYKDIDAFDPQNDEFRRELTKEFSWKMLKYRYELEKLIINENDQIRADKKKFLYKLEKNNTLLHLFDEGFESWLKQTESEIKVYKEISHTLPQAVNVRWLKQLATYRVYNQIQKDGGLFDEKNKDLVKPYPATCESPLRFKYYAESYFLEPQSDTDKKKFERIVSQCVFEKEKENNKDFPIRTVAAFNPDEHFVRISLPRKQTKNNRLSIQVNYRVDLQHKPSGETQEQDEKESFKNISSWKLLESIVEKVSKKINLRFISNSILTYSNTTERGRILMVGATKSSEPPTQALKRNIRYELMEEVDEKRPNVEFQKCLVSRYGAKRLFISCKFDFVNLRKANLRKELEKIIKETGFIPIYGDPQMTPDETDRKRDYLEQTVLRRIKSSQAFIQIIPKELEVETNQDWLLYELGVAGGAGIPYAICVDKSVVDLYPNKVGAGKPKFSFESGQDTEDILKEIQKALNYLAKRVYES